MNCPEILVLAFVLLALSAVHVAGAGVNQSVNETDGNCSSGRMSGEFLSTFEYWATPTDMSQYNPHREVTNPKGADEETIKAYPGMILLDNETAGKLSVAKGEIIDNENGTFTMIFYQDYDPGGADAGKDSVSESSPSFTFLSGIAGMISAGCILALLRKKRE